MKTEDFIDQIIAKTNENGIVMIYARVFRGFNREALNNPMDRHYLAFIPDSIKTTYFEDENSNTCKKTELTLRMMVYSPINRPSKQIFFVTESVTEHLSEAFIGELQDYSIGSLSYDESVNAFALPVLFRFVFNECPLGSGDEPVNTVIPDSFFCKGHINNSDVHLTEADRSYLSEPFVIGTYTGNGSSSGLDVNLGFRPRFVLVYRNSYHVSLYSSSDGISKCYMSVAADSTYTRGLLITENGFRARTVATSNATTYLNDEGGAYTYIAFR